LEPDSKRLTVLVVPCYNEERRLNPQAFAAFTRSRNDVRLLFVDDGSRDRTAEVIEQICRQGPAMELLRLPGNLGKAEAVRAGFRAAFGSSPRYLGYWDADLSTPLPALSSFEKVFDEHSSIEMVFGSRVMLLGRDIVREPYRHYSGRVFASLASVILKLPIYDTQCGAKLFRNTETLKQIFDSPFESRWVFDIEILARLETLRARGDGASPRTAFMSSPSSSGITSATPRSDFRICQG
jgi:dolichyl-phosphate beta-glucosyltransferase